MDFCIRVDDLKVTSSGPGPGEACHVDILTIPSRAQFRLDALGWHPAGYIAAAQYMGLRDGGRLVESYGVMRATALDQRGSINVPILTAPTFFSSQLVHWISTVAGTGGDDRVLRLRGMLISEERIAERYPPRKGVIDSLVGLLGVRV